MDYLILKKTPMTYQQIYYTYNKDYIIEQRKKYYIKNKEKLKEYNKSYQQENKERINEKFNCYCGGKFTRAHRSKHFKSKLHLDYNLNTLK